MIDAQELELATPKPGQAVLITNAMLNELRSPLITAEAELDAANKAYKKLPAQVPLSEVNPQQQALDTELKQVLHAFFDGGVHIIGLLVTEIRVNTTYTAKRTKAHDLVRRFLGHSGDLDPRQDGFLDMVFDPMSTGRDTKALGEL